MNENLTSPKAPCRYAFTNLSDTKFDKEGVFRIELILTPEIKEHADFLKELELLFKESNGNNKPFKKELHQETNEPTGNYIVRFKSKYHCKIFDAVNNIIERDKNFISNGSDVRVSYSTQNYKNMGGGVSLYLQAVKIINLIEWKGGEAEDYGFNKEEGYDSTGIPNNKVIDTKSLETEDDLPF